MSLAVRCFDLSGRSLVCLCWQGSFFSADFKSREEISSIHYFCWLHCRTFVFLSDDRNGPSNETKCSCYIDFGELDDKL